MAPMVIKANSLKGLILMTSSTLIILKVIFFFVTTIPSTSKLLDDNHNHFDHMKLKPPLLTDHHHHQSSTSQIFNPRISTHTHYDDVVRVLHEEQPPPSSTADDDRGFGLPPGGSSPEEETSVSVPPSQQPVLILLANTTSQAVVHDGGQRSATPSKVTKPLNGKEVYHDKSTFMENYVQMNKSLKIYIYPHAKTDPFANVLLPDNRGSPGGNYASESYFKIALSMSHFVTQDPSEADLFFLPFSIASMRHDKRIGVGGIKDFIKDYVYSISHKYPFWNRTGGADHFYVACHSIGKTAMEKAPQVSLNAIQVVCSSSYFLQGYTAHKDASIPQIWPRPGIRPTRHPSKREMVAFYAGAMNSRVRESLVQTWMNDTEIGVHQTRLKTPYSESLLGSKFCIHAKGFEVNTARIGDAIYYGCVPVVLADHYDLPFVDILDWGSFSVVVSTGDIQFLKKILKKIVDSGDYIKLQKNVLKVQNHFQWHQKPVDFDTFYMVMYELWLRRSFIRINLY